MGKDGHDHPAPDPAHKHASFLRSVLALDSSDPLLKRYVPPEADQPDGEPATPAPPTDLKKRPFWRAPPHRQR